MSCSDSYYGFTRSRSRSALQRYSALLWPGKAKDVASARREFSDLILYCCNSVGLPTLSLEKWHIAVVETLCELYPFIFGVQIWISENFSHLVSWWKKSINVWPVFLSRQAGCQEKSTCPTLTELQKEKCWRSKSLPPRIFKGEC